MINPKHVIDGWWHTVFKDHKFEPTAKARINICMENSCGYFSIFAGGSCKKCKCPIKVKSRCQSKDCKCDLGLW